MKGCMKWKKEKGIWKKWWKVKAHERWIKNRVRSLLWTTQQITSGILWIESVFRYESQQDETKDTNNEVWWNLMTRWQQNSEDSALNESMTQETP